jgi:hypothetical protein
MRPMLTVWEGACTRPRRRQTAGLWCSSRWPWRWRWRRSRSSPRHGPRPRPPARSAPSTPKAVLMKGAAVLQTGKGGAFCWYYYPATHHGLLSAWDVRPGLYGEPCLSSSFSILSWRSSRYSASLGSIPNFTARRCLAKVRLSSLARSGSRCCCLSASASSTAILLSSYPLNILRHQGLRAPS